MTPSDTRSTVALQCLLGGLMDMFWPESDYMPLGVPEMGEMNVMQVPRPSESLHVASRPGEHGPPGGEDGGGLGVPP